MARESLLTKWIVRLQTESEDPEPEYQKGGLQKNETVSVYDCGGCFLYWVY